MTRIRTDLRLLDAIVHKFDLKTVIYVHEDMLFRCLMKAHREKEFTC